MIRIKICGVTTPDDAAAISALGADAIGLNFIAESPRCIDAPTAQLIVTRISRDCTPIGLADCKDLEPTAQVLQDLMYWQIYNNTGQFELADALMYLPAYRIADRDDLIKAEADIRYHESILGDEHLYAAVLDSRSTTALGGTGVTAPWDLLAGFDPGVPVILAGGLTPDNVAEAIRIVRPWGVDVASGVESSPGVKDLHKVRDFIAAARGAFSAL